nr:immunoglobulin light chain junction region [Macaca mulatta]
CVAWDNSLSSRLF